MEVADTVSGGRALGGDTEKTERAAVTFSSSSTLRAPVQQVFWPATATQVAVVEGHNNQLVLEASLRHNSSALRRRTAAEWSDRVSSEEQCVNGSACENAAGDEGNGYHHEDPPQLHIRARYATKVAVVPVMVVRLLMTYSAVVSLGFYLILGLNVILQYMMGILIPLGQSGTVSGVALGLLSLSCLPSLCVLMSSLIALSTGLVLDIWQDLRWLECTAPLIPRAVRQWAVMLLTVFVPFGTYVVTSFVNSTYAYIYSLLAAFYCLQILYWFYFLTVAVERVRLCMKLMSDSHTEATRGGWKETLKRVIWVGLTLRNSSRPFCCRPRREDAPLKEEEGAAALATGVDADLKGVSVDVPDKEEAAAAGSWRGLAGLKFNQDTLEVEGTDQVDPTCCGGLYTIQDQYTLEALEHDSHGILTDYQASRIYTWCCVKTGMRSAQGSWSAEEQQQQQKQPLQRSDKAMAISATAAVALLVLLIILAFVPDAAQDHALGFTLTAFLLSVVVAAYLLRPACNRCKKDASDADSHGTPVATVYVPVGWMMVTVTTVRLLIFTVLPIVVFLSLSGYEMGYMSGAIIAASLYMVFIHMFDLELIMQWAGPAGLKRFESRGWIEGRTAYLFRHRMQKASILNGFLVFLALMALVLVIMAIGGINSQPNNRDGMDFIYNGTMRIRESYRDGQQYPICDIREPIPGLTVLDYAFLSDVSYIDNTTQAALRVDSYYGPGRIIGNYSPDLLKDIYGRFYVFQVAGTQDYVIAIRGTSSFLDLFADANNWLEVLMFQMLRFLVPAGEVWDPVYPYMIDLLGIKEGNKGFQYERAIAEQVQRLRAIPDSRVVLTGHSLGGGVGLIVSAFEETPAIIFNGPNALLSRRKFNVTEEQLNKWPINIIPGSDPIAHVDLPSKLAQRIDCGRQLFSCHQLESVYCELQDKCGALGRPVLNPEVCALWGSYNYTVIPTTPPSEVDTDADIAGNPAGSSNSTGSG